MPTQTQTSSFHARLASLKGELVKQGVSVERSIEEAIEAVFDRKGDKARSVIERDQHIDRVDVQIEKAAVQLLLDEWGQQAATPQDLRMLLTIVKVNNEYERIGDLAVVIAEKFDVIANLPGEPGAAPGKSPTIPPKFRMMGNCIIGIMHNTLAAFDRMDVAAAQLVLASDDATEAFRSALLRDVESGLVKGIHGVDYAFALGRIAYSMARMADHCTNVAEQVIYVATGKIVRHEGEKWTRPADPEA